MPFGKRLASHLFLHPLFLEKIIWYFCKSDCKLLCGDGAAAEFGYGDRCRDGRIEGFGSRHTLRI